MKKVVVVYKSSTGFTRKYAQWIQEELNCTTIELKDAHISEINQYDIIIFGSSIHANRIKDIKFITNNLEELKNNHVIVFATGATPGDAVEEVKRFEMENIPSDSNIPFFYFQSGMNYKDMKMSDKMIMNCLKLVLRMKKDRNSSEQGTLDSITHSYDHSNKTYITPLINYVRGL